MRTSKSKFTKFISLSLVLMLAISVNAFAGSTGQIRVGSGGTEGWVTGDCSIGGNGTVGYYANASTIFDRSGYANAGTSVAVKLTLVNTSTNKTLYTNTDTVVLGATGTQVQAKLYSGAFAVSSPSNLTATSVHTLSGPVTFSRTLTTKW